MNDERRMDGDKFVEFVFRETNDTDLTNTVKNLVNEYLNRKVPQVSLGQEVWIVNGYDKHWRIIKGCIVRIQFKKKYSFVVHYNDWRGGAAYSKNSIGKTVFFTEEDAKKAIEEKNV
jgi:hypothetical protein